MNAEDAWYKNNAIDFSRLQIAVDTFLFSAQYTDLATLSQLSKITAGSTFYYSGFFSKIDGKKFEKDFMTYFSGGGWGGRQPSFVIWGK